MIVQLNSYLFQGDRSDAEHICLNHKVNVVIFLSLFPLILPLALKTTVTVIHIPMRDEQENEDKIRIINDVITQVSRAYEPRERRVLVACDAGMSRSAMMCIYHLVYTGSSFDDAEKLMKEKNPRFLPEQSLYLQIKKMLTGT